MTDEHALLREYVSTRSQEAFATLTGRYVDLVYSAARRQVGDAQLAEDVAQAVFIILAQKAPAVPVGRPLSAWLLKTTSYCAANVRRSRGRRLANERRAAEMMRSNQTDAETDSAWAELSPLLDEGMNKLRSQDRDALLLKFFEHKSLKQVGETLGISEEAAQKRVTRAVEKLRDFFRRRGVAVSAGAPPVMLASETIHAAPAALSAAMTTTIAAGSTTSAAAVAKGAMLAMAMQKTTVTIAAGIALLLAVGGGAVLVHSIGGPSGKRTIAVPVTASELASSATFSDGTTVKVVGISEVPSQGAVGWVTGLFSNGAATVPASTLWWSADGSKVPPVSLAGLGQINTSSAMGRRQIRLVLSTRGPSAGEGVAISLADVSSSANSSRTVQGEVLTNYVGSVPDNLDRSDLRLGLSKGEWREDASAPVNPAKPSTQPAGQARIDKISDEQGRCVVEMNQNEFPAAPGRDRRIVAVLRDGKNVGANEWSGYPLGRSVIKFPCSSDQVDRIALLTRPFEWATIKAVSLKPATMPAVAARK